VTRPQSEPKLAIGIPDGTWTPRPRFCSGASMLVDHATYRALERDGVRWATRSDEIPVDGKGTARVACNGQELTLERGSTVYTYALCKQCMVLESEFRAALAAKAAPASGGRR
jgi:hypothetical protein